jgi:Xaa-Pro dipeptidase
MTEVSIKEKRLLDFMRTNNYAAVVIGRQDNFAWLSCGGHNRVASTTEQGVCLAVFTEKKKYIIACSMDGRRIIDEDLQGMGYDLVELKWYEESPAEKAAQLLKGMNVFSDTVIPGTDGKVLTGPFQELHYPLTDGEIERYRWLGRKAEEAVRSVADCIRPGMSESDVEMLLRHEYARNGIDVCVMIIGSDERISKYRHCTPTGKKIEKMVMMAPAVQKWGLTVPLTRMICFENRIPGDIEDKYDAVCAIEAETMSRCFPGSSFTGIFERQKVVFSERGYPEEWRNHFQGGITGYVINDPTRCTDPEARIADRQTFNWYITITGVKVEETMLVNGDTIEILTSTGLWPVKRYETGRHVIGLPQILLR